MVTKVRLANFVVGRPNLEAQCCDVAAPILDEVISYKAVTGFVTVTAGDIALRLRLYGDQGWTDKRVTLPGPGYFVVALFGKGVVGTPLLIDTPVEDASQYNEPPRVRLYNLSVDAGTAALVLDPGTANEKEVVKNIDVGTGSAYQALTGITGTHTLKVVSGSGSQYVSDFDLGKNGFYTAFLIGFAGGIETQRPEAVAMSDR
jgi:hypothetical protein